MTRSSTTRSIEVQGHRGARGLAPENTLAGFQLAIECGVDSIETDVHLSKDGVPVLCHDPRPAAGAPLLRELTALELRDFAVPTLSDLFALADERVIFDLELKRVPFVPELIGDDYNGDGPGLLERRVAQAIEQAGVLHRTRVRSFDHRSVRAIRQLLPGIQTGLLTYHTAPADYAAHLADAEMYCPHYLFVDEHIVQQVHAAGKRIIPYTVNEPAEWQRLVEWGVDGITTDFPDQLLKWLKEPRTK